MKHFIAPNPGLFYLQDHMHTDQESNAHFKNFSSLHLNTAWGISNIELIMTWIIASLGFVFANWKLLFHIQRYNAS